MAEMEKGKSRPVLWFAGMQKGLVLNKTNALVIAGAYGTNSDEWIVQKITLYPTQCEMKGQIVPCIRVRIDVGAVAGAHGFFQHATPAVHTVPVPQVQAVSPPVNGVALAGVSF